MAFLELVSTFVLAFSQLMDIPSEYKIPVVIAVSKRVMAVKDYEDGVVGRLDTIMVMLLLCLYAHTVYIPWTFKI